jgi:hypothetical protein
MARVTIEGSAPVTKKSGHRAIAPGDVCQTPMPNGAIVPVPYVNVAQSSSLRGGSHSVTIGGASVLLGDAELAHSRGNELGTRGGVRSGKTRGPAQPLQTSLHVTIEGQRVVRGGDAILQNGRNALGRLH